MFDSSNRTKKKCWSLITRKRFPVPSPTSSQGTRTPLLQRHRSADAFEQPLILVTSSMRSTACWSSRHGRSSVFKAIRSNNLVMSGMRLGIFSDGRCSIANVTLGGRLLCICCVATIQHHHDGARGSRAVLLCLLASHLNGARFHDTAFIGRSATGLLLD